MFSRRSALPRRPNRFSLAVERARHAGVELCDLTLSNPTRAAIPLPESLLQALADPAALDYDPEPFGLRSAREAVARFMAGQGVAVSPERVVLTASTSEAYAFVLKLLCDPGDRVLVPRPSYPLLAHLAAFESVELASYPLVYDGRWHLDPGALRQSLEGDVRAVLTVNPNNPTGSFLKRDELAALRALGVPLISDEVFAPYALSLDADACTTAFGAAPCLTFTLHGLSKLLALPQMKLSWVLIDGPEALVSEALARLELIADAFLSVATPIQQALPVLLREHGAITRAVRARVTRNYGVLRRLLEGSALTALHVEGGWYAVVRLPSLLDDEGWALDLLEHAATLVQPGYFYDFDDGPYAVLSLLTPEAGFTLGIERLLERVQAVIAGAHR